MDSSCLGVPSSRKRRLRAVATRRKLWACRQLDLPFSSSEKQCPHCLHERFAKQHVIVQGFHEVVDYGVSSDSLSRQCTAVRMLRSWWRRIKYEKIQEQLRYLWTILSFCMRLPAEYIDIVQPSLEMVDSSVPVAENIDEDAADNPWCDLIPARHRYGNRSSGSETVVAYDIISDSSLDDWPSWAEAFAADKAANDPSLADVNGMITNVATNASEVQRLVVSYEEKISSYEEKSRT